MFLAQEVWVELFDRDPDVGIRMQTGLIKDLYARIHAINAEYGSCATAAGRLIAFAVSQSSTGAV